MEFENHLGIHEVQMTLTLDSIMDWIVQLTIVLALPFTADCESSCCPPPQFQAQLRISNALCMTIDTDNIIL